LLRAASAQLKPLPSPEALARLVSYVTDTMLTLPCALLPGADTPARLRTLSWRTALVPIPGARPLTIALSSDEKGCLALAAALFACDAKAVDLEMIDDTLGELVNMIAGQVRTAVVQDQALGLPRIDTSPDAAAPARCIVLGAGTFHVVVGVIDG
jgi:hypothetical protein